MIFTHACYAHSPSPSHVHMTWVGGGWGGGRNLDSGIEGCFFLVLFFFVWILCVKL